MTREDAHASIPAGRDVCVRCLAVVFARVASLRVVLLMGAGLRTFLAIVISFIRTTVFAVVLLKEFLNLLAAGTFAFIGILLFVGGALATIIIIFGGLCFGSGFFLICLPPASVPFVGSNLFVGGALVTISIITIGIIIITINVIIIIMVLFVVLSFPLLQFSWVVGVASVEMSLLLLVLLSLLLISDAGLLPTFTFYDL